MNTIWQDLRYGVRMLAKNPGFTAVAVLTLALGIGANTAIFSVVDAVLFRPLPYDQSDRLVQVWPVNVKRGFEGGVPFPNYFDWRDQNHVFEEMAAYADIFFNATGENEPQRILGAGVSSSLFPLLGAKVMIGRTLLPEDDRPEASLVILVSHRLWQQRFGADPQLVGKTLTLDGKSYTVVGIMPPTFHFPEDEEIDLWAPATLLYAGIVSNRNAGSLNVIARLKRGVTLKQAQVEMETISRRLEQQYPDANAGWSVRLIPFQEMLVGKIQRSLLVLLGAVAFVLLIACANVTNLLLARATARQKELAIRTALGASRRRLVRQFLTESVLLGLCGGIGGLMLALWGVDLLVAMLPDSLPRVHEIGIDRPVLGFTLGISILTGLIFGLVPAMHGSKSAPNESLKEGSRTTAGHAGRNRIRSLLVIAEVALSLMLLVGAGLLIKSFWRLQQVKPGFNPENVLSVSLTLPDYKYSAEKSRQLAFYRQVMQRLERLPGVRSVGMSTILPLGGSRSRSGFTIEGRPLSSPRPLADDREISPHYFQTLGIPLLRGRVFTDGDREGTSPVVIINETMAQRFWPDEDPIGQHIAMERVKYEIVGIVGDVKHMSLAVASSPELYLPYPQMPGLWVNFVIRTAANPTSLAEAVRSAIRAIDKDQPISRVATLEQLRSRSVSQPRFNTLLLGVFAAVALVLAAVGLYGVMAYSVTQRTHEIGVRMALGAQTTDVLKLVVRQGMWLTCVGLGIGLVGAFASTRVLSTLMYGVNTTDPTTFVSVSLLLVGVALLACYLPARRATRVDPMGALRYE